MKLNVVDYLYHGVNGLNNERNLNYHDDMFKSSNKESVVTRVHHYDDSYIFPYSLRVIESVLEHQGIYSRNELIKRGITIDTPLSDIQLDNECINISKIGSNESFIDHCSEGVSLMITKDIRKSLRYVYNSEVEVLYGYVAPQGESKCLDPITLSYIHGIYVNLNLLNMERYASFINTLKDILDRYNSDISIVDQNGDEIKRVYVRK